MRLDCKKLLISTILFHVLCVVQSLGSRNISPSSGCNNAGIPPSPKTAVLLYHKPPHVVVTDAVQDSHGDRQNIYQNIIGGSRGSEFVQLTRKHGRFRSVGRLDAETTGLLLLTNSGPLLHFITNKNAKQSNCFLNNSSKNAFRIGKTYEAVIMGFHKNDSAILGTLRTTGVNIGEKHGGRTDPVPDLRVLSHPSSTTTQVSLTLFEGKNRQIRRMFHALGSGVMKLKRVSIGGEHKLVLGDLLPGDWRVLSDDEVRQGLHWDPNLSPSVSSSHGRKSGKNNAGSRRKGNSNRRKLSS